MKKYIPQVVKLNYRLSSRYLKDLTSGVSGKFAKGDREALHYNGMIETSEDITSGEYAENTLQNIRLAVKEISKLQLLPGEVFSFWKVLGNPTKGKGYKTGRTIVEGELVEGVGGGLCQLAGLMYYAALKAGLEIMERHAHSASIFRASENGIPLGADAAVVYGYKDLRIKNSRGFPIKFTFIVKDSRVACRIFLEDNITPYSAKFELRENEGTKTVTTYLIDENGEKKIVGESRYSD